MSWHTLERTAAVSGAVSAGYFLLLLPLLLSNGKHGTLSSAWGHPRAHRMPCHESEHMASPVGCASKLTIILCAIIPRAQLLTRTASCWVVLVASASNSCHGRCCRGCNPSSLTTSAALHPACIPHSFFVLFISTRSVSTTPARIHGARQANKSRSVHSPITPLQKCLSVSGAPVLLPQTSPPLKARFRMRHHFFMSCSPSHSSSISQVHIVLPTTLDSTFLHLFPFCNHNLANSYSSSLSDCFLV